MITYKSKIAKVRLVREPSDIAKIKIQSSKDVADYARSFYKEDITLFESFYIILLNNANNTTGYVKISQGGITGTMVDVRLVAKYALEGMATSIILIHNHPSGTLRASSSDKQITSKIQKGLELLEIKVLDHIILTGNDYYSFLDEGIL